MEEYSDNSYQVLEAALLRAESAAHRSPDQYQYYQNELTKHMACFLLLRYKQKKMMKNLDN